MLFVEPFEELTDPILANRKVFWMQQCVGGDFSGVLEATNTVFNSATHHELGTQADNLTINGQVIDEFDFFQAEQNDNTSHGEFNFHMYSSTMGESPTGINNYDGDLYTNADLNGDNVISVYEASHWHGIKESAPETQKFVDLGGIGAHTSLKYPTLLWKNAYSNETYRGIIGISKSFTVEPGVELTFLNKSKIEVLNGAELTVKSGATLTIGNNVDIINGKIIIEDGATVNIDTDLYLDKTEILFHNSAVNISGAHLDNQSKFWIHGTGTFEFVNSYFSDGSQIRGVGNKGTTIVDYCIFNDSYIDINNNTLTLNSSVSITNNTFNNSNI